MTRNTPPRSSGSSGASGKGKGARRGGSQPGQVARPRWGRPNRPEATDREGLTARTAPVVPGDAPEEKSVRGDKPGRGDKAARAEKPARDSRDSRDARDGKGAAGAARKAPRKQAVRPPKALRGAAARTSRPEAPSG